jgi:drug/metabolite transporter (DMT)-like permease
MELRAVAVLMVAAGIHSAWNLISKRGVDKQAFLWLAMLMTALLFAVPFTFLYTPIPPYAWVIIALSGVLESAYILLLGRAYQHGDLSLVYPIARGSAIMFVTLLAVLLLGEHVPWLGAVGILVIVCGMVVTNLTSLSVGALRAPIASLGTGPSRLALMTGLSTASYSLVDKVGVRYVPPMLYVYLIFAAGALFMMPYMLGMRRAAVAREWQANKWRIVLVSVMFITTYLLVLSVMATAQVSFVASVREVSVIFAALMGTLVLREPFGQQKVLGAALIFLGILCIGMA